MRPLTDLAGLAVAPSARPGVGRASGLAAAEEEAPEQGWRAREGRRGSEGGSCAGAEPADREGGGGEPAVLPVAARRSRARRSRGRGREEGSRAALPPWRPAAAGKLARAPARPYSPPKIRTGATAGEEGGGRNGGRRGDTLLAMELEVPRAHGGRKEERRRVREEGGGPAPPHGRRERWSTAATAGRHASGSSAAAANAIEGRGRGGVKKDRKF